VSHSFAQNYISSHDVLALEKSYYIFLTTQPATAHQKLTYLKSVQKRPKNNHLATLIMTQMEGSNWYNEASKKSVTKALPGSF